VEADQPIDNYWMRMVATEGCSNITNKDLTAILRYEGAPIVDPTSTAHVPANQICEDETQLVPIVTRNAGPFSFLLEWTSPSTKKCSPIKESSLGTSTGQHSSSTGPIQLYFSSIIKILPTPLNTMSLNSMEQNLNGFTL